MGELSPVHIAIVLAIVLLVFGPKKLPEMGRSLGKGIREFRDATSGLKDDFSLGLEGKPVAPAATPVTPTATVVTPAAGDAIALATVAPAVSVANATVTATPPLPPASEVDRAALAAYGIDADGKPIVVDAVAAQATPPSVFVDANGNEYRLAAAAPAAEPAANVALDAAADQTPDALSNQAII
jgi:sec-independent protein translocase protein TatA